jgi:chromosome partitioning protein
MFYTGSIITSSDERHCTMQRIAITNQKGGVGKTTIAAHLAAGLVQHDHEVLAIDLDPQGYLMAHYGLREDHYRKEADNLALHLVDESDGTFDDLIVSTEEGVDLIPSNYDMRGVTDALHNARNRERRLESLLSDLSDDAYDFIIIDSPPNLGVLTDNAILATQRVLIPIQAEDSSLDALDMALDEIDEIESAFGIDVEILGIVPNLVPRDGIADSTLETLRSTDGLQNLVFPYEIRKRADIKYAMRHGQTLYTYNDESDMIPVFDQLTADMEEAVH